MTDIMVEPGLKKYFEVLTRRWWLVASVMGVSTAASLAFALSEVPMYESEAKLLARSDTSASLTGLDKSGLDSVGDLRALGELSDPVVTIVESMRSHALMQQVINTVGLSDDEGEPVASKDLLKALEIEAIPGADIISIKFSHEDPAVAARVVDTTAALFVQANIQQNRSKTSEAREFIEQNLPAVQNKLIQAEKAYTKFKELYKVTSLEEESKESLKLLSRLEDKLIENQTNLASAQEKAGNLTGRLGQQSREALDSVNLSQTPGIRTLLSRKQELEEELDSALTTYQANHPVVVSLTQEIEASQIRLQALSRTVLDQREPSNLEADAQMGALKQELSSDLIRTELDRDSLAQEYERIQQLMANYRNRLDMLPRLQQQHDQLEREQTAAKNTYESLLQQLQEIQVAENQTIGGVTSLSSAVIADEPLPSSKKMTLLLGMLVGALLSVSLVFLLEILEELLGNPREIDEASGYPILGIIPETSKPHGLIPAISSRASKFLSSQKYREMKELERSYRKLRSNLKQSFRGRSHSIILMTSLKPGEENEAIASNLAAIIAKGNRQVLLLDLASRKSNNSSANRVWNYLDRPGLLQIERKQASLQDCIQQPIKNLSVLGLGKSSSMNEMPSSKGLSLILDMAANAYDLILINAPSISRYSDLDYLVRDADQIILTVQSSSSNSLNITNLDAFPDEIEHKLIGLIVNKIGHQNNALTGRSDERNTLKNEIVIR